ncbi:hypothetical protein BDR04DRAFT_1119545 [Suillus decipiens]|nr:hypothetical protein BDR04DRAFT_1119545 [Suillus decipiens]
MSITYPSKVLEQTCTTAKTSMTVTSTEKPNPPKKVKLEPALLIISEPILMSADMPKFWFIEAKKLLPGLQAIFDVAFPRIDHNVQPKGLIMGLVNQHLCSWLSNFGSTDIALITNFLATSKDNDIGDEDNEDDYEQELVASLLENWAFLYEDPENCDPDKIYQSVFILEMIETAHINATAGSLNVPALDTDALQLKGMQAVITASAAAQSQRIFLITSALEPAA